MSVMSQHHARLWGDDRQSLRVSSQGLGGAHIHPDTLLWGRRKMCGPADFPASLHHYVVISEVLLNFPQMQSLLRKDAVSCAPLWECPCASFCSVTASGNTGSAGHTCPGAHTVPAVSGPVTDPRACFSRNPFTIL